MLTQHGKTSQSPFLTRTAKQIEPCFMKRVSNVALFDEAGARRVITSNFCFPWMLAPVQNPRKQFS